MRKETRSCHKEEAEQIQLTLSTFFKVTDSIESCFVRSMGIISTLLRLSRRELSVLYYYYSREMHDEVGALL